MTSPNFVPSEDWAAASEDLRRSIQETCHSLEHSILGGQLHRWHFSIQNDHKYPYVLTAYSVPSNQVFRQFSLDREGKYGTNSTDSANLSSPRRFTSSPTSSDPVSQFIARQLAEYNITLIRLDVGPDQTSTDYANPQQLFTAVVDVIRGDQRHIEDGLREAYLAAARGGLHGNHFGGELPLSGSDANIRFRLQQHKGPVLLSGKANGETKLHTSPTHGGSTSTLRATGLQKKTSMSSLKSATASPRSPVSRRTSTNLLPSRSTSSPKLPSTAAQEPRPPPMTPSTVAKGFFERDLMQHEDRSGVEMVVIIHDSCYGHRFSRPKTSKANLSTIVERPERLLATLLGVSAAYVLMGERHCGAHYAPHPDQIPDKFPFKIRKSNRFVPLVSPTVTNVHGTKWMNELKMMCEGAEAKLTSTGRELVRPAVLTGADPLEDKPSLHEGDLYLSEESLNAFEGALGGVLDAVDVVFDVAGPRRSFVGIRPPGHHCSADYPSGFCWLNNVHVGISHAAAVHGMTHAAIIDFDLHHGDGSQAIVWDHNARVASLPRNAAYSKRTAIGYFSLHDINSYPCEWGDAEKVQNASLCMEQAHGQSIWNVHLQPWKTDAEFWELYDKRYSILLDKTRSFLLHHTERLQNTNSAPQPRAAIFISAGFDASEWEGHGMQRHKVNVPTDFYARFTRDIVELANESGLGADGRIISVLEGGYSDRALTSGVLAHLSGMASKVDVTSPGDGLASEMASRLGSLSLGQNAVAPSEPGSQQLDPQAWSPSALDELLSAANPPPPVAPKQPRGPVNPTYSTPTQSFTAKMQPIARHSLNSSQDVARAAPVQEVIPDVGWATAALELSKVLTPYRQTQSCKPEDLNAQATKARRDRQSGTGLETEMVLESSENKGMQLRAKKGKAPSTESNRPTSRSSRRTTIGGTELSDLLSSQSETPPKAPRRRISMASTVMSTAEEPKEMAPAPRTRRTSSASAARPSSAASRKGETIAKTPRKPRSPSKPRPQKRAVGVSTPRAPPPKKTSSAASSDGRPDSAVDSITDGVQKMRIKLNLPPKQVEPPKEAKARPGRPRKTQSATKVPTTTKAARKTAPAQARQPSAASTASSSALSGTTVTTSSTATTMLPEGASHRVLPSEDRKTTDNLTTPTATEKDESLLDKVLSNSSVESRPTQRSGQRSEAQSPDGYDSTFAVKPFDAAKASGDTKEQGAMGAMGTMLSPTQTQASLSSFTTGRPETPKGSRQLPTFTSTSPIPFALAANAGARNVPTPSLDSRIKKESDTDANEVM